MQRYVPDSLRRRWAEGGNPRTPAASTHPGVVCFADITGFTPLVGRMTGKGRAEIEELRHALDAYFGRLVARVTEFGGDVLAFEGDALLATWAGSDDDRVARRAAACAVAIRDELNAWAAAPGVQLELRLVVASGELTEITVGGVGNRWEHLVVGPAMAAIAPGLKRAAPGEVVVTTEVWRALAADGEGTALDDNYVRLGRLTREVTTAPLALTPVGEAARDLLEGRLLPAVRLWGEDQRFLGERRTVSTLFVQLPRVDPAANGWLDELQVSVSTCQRIVGKWEGTLTEVTSGDKDVVMVACWGLPPLAHEDDATGAVEAAMALHQAFASRGRKISAGVTTGMVYCGVVGSEIRAAYTTLGAPVNLAARLMQAAAGRILVDRPTRERVAERIACGDSASLTVKGQAEPVAVSSPLGRSGTGLGPVAQELVGREAECARLDAGLERLLSGVGGGFVLLDGEPGAGKSALVSRLHRAALDRGALVLVGEGRLVFRSTPYHAIAPAVAGALGLQLSPDAPLAATGVTDRLAGSRDDLDRAPLLNAILSISQPETPYTRAFSDEAAVDARHAFAADLLRRRTQAERVVVIVEDAHWLDSASSTLLRILIRSVPDALFVVAQRARSGDNLHAWHEFRDAPGSVHLSLQPLPADDLRVLAERHLGVARLPDAVRRLLVERAAGNPFYAQELMSALRASGKIRIEGGQCVLAQEALDAATVPTTVAGLVVARVDRLPAPEQRILKLASVMGRSFATAAILAMAGTDLTGETIADTLERSDLVHPTAGTGQFEFGHMLVREAIYDGLLLDQRREMHRAVFRWLVGDRTDAQLQPLFPALAHHAAAAEDWPNALRYLELAGEQALTQWANAEAARFQAAALEVSRAHQLPIDAVREGRWEARLAEASFRLGDMEGTIAAGYRALERWNTPLPRTGFGEFRAVIREWAARYFGQRIPELGEADRRLLLDLYGRLIDAHGFQQSAGGFLLGIFRELSLSELLDMPGRSARAWLMFYFFFAVTPLEPRVRPWVERARTLLARETDPSRRASATLRLGIASVYNADWEAATTAMGQGMALHEAQGEQRGLSEALVSTAHLHAIRGEFAPIGGLAARIHGITELTGDRQIEGVASALLADSLARTGDLPGAERVLVDAAELLDALATGGNRVLGQGVRAWVMLQTGEGERAETLAIDAIEHHEKMLAPVFWTHAGLLGATEVLFQRWASQGGAQRARNARRAVKQAVRNGNCFRFGRTLAACAQAWLARAEGRDAAARDARARALEFARSDGIQHLEARILAESNAG